MSFLDEPREQFGDLGLLVGGEWLGRVLAGPVGDGGGPVRVGGEPLGEVHGVRERVALAVVVVDDLPRSAVAAGKHDHADRVVGAVETGQGVVHRSALSRSRSRLARVRTIS